MKKYAAFYIPYLLFVLTSIVLILCNSKADLHLWLNSFHTTVGDFFFKYYTEVGASVPFIIAAGLLFYRYRFALVVLISQLLSGLMVQIMKKLWNEPRPKTFFTENFPSVQLHQIDGVQLHASFGFPSGHTTSAFALFLALTFFTKQPRLHLLYFILAVLVGYSRIYLSQHFALDVLAGSFIGVSTTILCQLYFEKQSFRWADGSLRDVFLIKK